MITYDVLIDKDGIYFCCYGHAGHTEKHIDAAGNNLVCAVVSAISQTCAAGCGEYSSRYDEKACEAGRLEFICSRNPQTEAIVRAALLGLDEAVRQYPEQVQRGDVDVG